MSKHDSVYPQLLKICIESAELAPKTKESLRCFVATSFNVDSGIRSLPN